MCLYQRGCVAARVKILFSSPLWDPVSLRTHRLGSANEANTWQHSNCFRCAVKEENILINVPSKQTPNVQCRPRHWFLRSLARRYPMSALSIDHAPLQVCSVHLVPCNRTARGHDSRTGGNYQLRFRPSGRCYCRRYGVNGRV